MFQSKDRGYQSGLKHRIRDAWVYQGVEHLPLTQVVILESGMKSHIGLLVGSLLLSLPKFLPLSLTIVNNIIKNQHPSVRCLQDVHLRPIDTSRLIGEGKSSTTLMDIKRKLEDAYLYQTNEIWNQTLGDTWWLRLSICSQLRVWSWDPRIESHIGLP